MEINNRKVEFLNNYTSNESSAYTIGQLFKRVAPYEAKFGSDLCEFSQDQLQEVYDNVLAIRSYSKATRLPILKEYLSWCKDKGFGNAYDYVDSMSLDGSGLWKSQAVTSPGDLKTILDSVFDDPSLQTIDNVYRGYIWLGYCGVDEKLLETLKPSDVDVTNGTISAGGIKYVLVPEAMQELTNLVRQDYFMYIHPLHTTDKPTKRNRYNNDQLLRGIKTGFVATAIREVVSRTMTKAFNTGKTDRKITYSKAYISGLFYRSYLIEQDTGVLPDFDDEVHKRYNLDEIRVKDYVRYRWVSNRKKAQYMTDYMAWKKAFGLKTT